MLRFTQFLSWITVSTALCSCAQVRSISGGEKDTIPPHIVDVSPDSLSKHFAGNSFTVVFDEYVQVRNVQQELLVSPPLRKQPRVQLHQRELMVSWDDTLARNTTYTFQFGEAISDLNEGNPLQDFAYVFTTGEALDSMHCSGVVVDAQLDAPAKSIKVFLFDSIHQVFDKKQRPVYYARTDEQGRFTLNYLRPGHFTLCALSDENGNYHYDAGESIDWIENIESTIRIDSSAHRLQISVPRDTIWTIGDYKTDSLGALRFYVEPWMHDIRLRAIDSQALMQWQAGDTIYASPVSVISDGIRYEVDLNGTKCDTVDAENMISQKTQFRIMSKIGDKIRVSESLELKAQRRISGIDTMRIQLFEDSIAIAFKLDQTIPDRVKLSAVWRAGRKYECLVLPGFILDGVGSVNDTLRLNFGVYESKELGALLLQLPEAVEQTNTLLVLKDKGGVTVFTALNLKAGVVSIPGLLPGEYSACITEDFNANGLFDPLVIHPFQATEVNHYYPGKIVVRTNWDVEISWPDWRDSDWRAR